jgi:hypothetical protein
MAYAEYQIWPCAHVAYKTRDSIPRHRLVALVYTGRMRVGQVVASSTKKKKERGDDSCGGPPRLGAMQLRLYQTLGGLADGPNGSAVVIPFPADLVRAFSRT